jgi:hypothetical protein
MVTVLPGGIDRLAADSINSLAGLYLLECE